MKSKKFKKGDICILLKKKNILGISKKNFKVRIIREIKNDNYFYPLYYSESLRVC
jgi:hypothetical protein